MSVSFKEIEQSLIEQFVKPYAENPNPDIGTPLIAELSAINARMIVAALEQYHLSLES